MSAPPADAVHGLSAGGGTADLLLSYGIVVAAMGAGLYRSRAPAGRYLAAPLLSLALVVIGGALWAFLAHWVPRGLTRGAGAVWLAGFGFLVGRWLPPVRHESHKRGAYVEDTATELRGASRLGTAAGVTLAAEAVPALDEIKHFKLIGTTGTGKSTAIRELLRGALRRGDRAVIADPDGGYLARFHDPDRGDVILNPFDARSRKWDLLGEIRNPYDFEQLARSLVPDGAGEDRVWNRYAQTLLTAVMRQAYQSGIRDTAELYRLVTAAPVEEIRVLVEGTPAQAFVAAGNDRMWGSIRSVTTAAVAALDFINAQRSALLSIRQWVRDGRGVLFLPYQADQIAALRAVISTWMRIAIVETMNSSEGDARLWFIVDELDALGQIDGLKDALVRLRKFGGRCVLGFQSIAQVSGTYGRSEAETIVENCGNTLILRCSASEHGGTARFASNLIGEREVVRKQVSRSRRAWQFQSTTTSSEQHIVESAVLPSEIEQLADLRGYLKLASTPFWRRVRLSVD